MFELVQLGRRRSRACAGSAYAALPDAIQAAREQAIGEPMSVIEIRDRGVAVCTVGHGWMSRRLDLRKGRAEA